MKYPTIAAVEIAERTQICKWYRFLPFSNTNEQITVNALVCKRYTELGGMTSEISKLICWDDE